MVLVIWFLSFPPLTFQFFLSIFRLLIPADPLLEIPYILGSLFGPYLQQKTGIFAGGEGKRTKDTDATPFFCYSKASKGEKDSRGGLRERKIVANLRTGNCVHVDLFISG
jgi:hypothetical protein